MHAIHPYVQHTIFRLTRTNSIQLTTSCLSEDFSQSKKKGNRPSSPCMYSNAAVKTLRVWTEVDVALDLNLIRVNPTREIRPRDHPLQSSLRMRSHTHTRARAHTHTHTHTHTRISPDTETYRTSGSPMANRVNYVNRC